MIRSSCASTSTRWGDLGFWLALAGFPELGVEAVTADVGRSDQHLFDGINAPTPAVTGADTRSVETIGDRLVSPIGPELPFKRGGRSAARPSARKGSISTEMRKLVSSIVTGITLRWVVGAIEERTVSRIGAIDCRSSPRC